MAASENRSSPRVAPRSVTRATAISSMISSMVSALGLDGAGQGHVADGAEADRLSAHLLARRVGGMNSLTA